MLLFLVIILAETMTSAGQYIPTEADGGAEVYYHLAQSARGTLTLTGSVSMGRRGMVPHGTITYSNGTTSDPFPLSKLCLVSTAEARNNDSTNAINKV